MVGRRLGWWCCVVLGGAAYGLGGAALLLFRATKMILSWFRSLACLIDSYSIV